MERLTIKVSENPIAYQCRKPADKFDGTELIRANRKLGKLEDIEEELGIPLEVLFKALKDGIWVKHRPFENKDITFYKNCELQYQLNTWVFWIGEPDNEFVRILKEYKFGWALTKEELE